MRLFIFIDTQSDEATSLMTRMSKLGSDISNKILFFDLWWKTQVDEKNAKRLIKDAVILSEYLGHKRLIAKYSLSEPEGNHQHIRCYRISNCKIV